MPHDIVWIWSKPRIEDLIASYSDQVEGSKDAPMLYVAMSPGAVLKLMQSMGMSSVAAMVRMPGEAEPTERTLNPTPFVPTKELQVDEPSMQDQVALALRGCSQCGQPWDEWACGPTHAMLREQMGIEPKWYSIEEMQAAQAAEDFFAMPQPHG